jgi:hypothetical protein
MSFGAGNGQPDFADQIIGRDVAAKHHDTMS